MHSFAVAVEAEWRSLLHARLNTSYDAYSQSLVVRSRDGGLTQEFVLVVGPKQWLANAIEFGLPAYNMKTAILRDGITSKVMKFRFYTQKPTGPSRFQHDSSAEQWYGLQRDLKRANTPAKRERVTGKLSRWNARERGRKTVSRTGYESQYGKLERLTHSQQHKMTTMRTISVNSPARSWQHPGIAPRNFRLHLERRLPAIKARTVDPIMRALGGRL
tara:strand:- start:291 stop:941 length:651 start_codon:yes stop_codon:yes gene_type:complete